MGAPPAKRQHVWILWSSLALLGLVGLCVTWLFTADLGAFKPQLENLVSEQLGRDFSIEGELDIHLGRSLVVSAEGIVLENVAWSDEPPMLDVGRVAASVNLWSIFSGPIIVELVDIDDLTLNLVKSATNENNWTFALARSTAKPAAEKKSFDVRLQTLETDAVRIVYVNAHRPEPVDINILSLRQKHRDDDMLETSVNATVNGQDIKLQATFGTWASLLSGRNVEFDSKGQLGTVSVQARGLIDDLQKPSRPVIEFNIAGPSVAEISSMLGLGEVGEGDIDLAGSLSVERDGPLTLNLNGNLGQTLVNATGSAAAIDDFENVDMTLAASGPNLGRVLSYFGIDQVRNAPFEIALSLRRAGEVLSFDNTRLTFGDSILDAHGSIPNFPALKDATVGIEFAGPQIEHLRYVLGIPGYATGPFSARLDVQADEFGKPTLQARLQTTLARLVARGEIGDPPGYVGSHIDFELDAPSLQQLGRFANTERLPDQPVSARGSVVWNDGRLDLDKPLRLSTEGIAASVSGAVHLRPRLLNTALQIEVEGVDLHDALRRFDVDIGLPALAYKVSGGARFGADGVELQGVAVELGTSAIELEGLVDTRSGLSGTRLKIGGSGPAMEELFAGLEKVSVFPGAFEAAASIELRDSEILVRNFRLSRERGKIALDAKVGWPLATKRLELDLDASSPDIRSLFTDLGGFEPESAPYRINATVRRNGDEWSFTPLQASLGNAKVAARGQLTLAPQSVSGRLRIEADVPNLAAVGRYQGKQPRQLPLSMSGTLSGGGDHVAIDDLSASLGESSIMGHAAYRFGTVPDIELSLQSESLAVLPIFEEAANEPDPAPAAADGRIIPTTEIPFAALRRVNGTFDIKIGELQRNNLHAQNVQLQGTLRDGTLSVDTLRLETREGTIAASGALVAGETGGQAHVRLAADDLALTSSSSHPVRADVDFDILATGSNLRELAANANGFFALQAANGELEKSAMMDLFYGGFAEELLKAINPFAESKDVSKLDCAVVVLEILDGVAQRAPAAYAQTDSVRVLASALVDLGTEKLKIGFETIPSKSLSFLSFSEVVSPYFAVEGTFSKPRVKLDEKSAIVAGGAAAATAGLSIVAKGLWNRMKKSEDACDRAAEQAQATISAHANQGTP